jgi:hypothetical protein
MRQQVSILTCAGLSQRYNFIGKLGVERSQMALLGHPNSRDSASQPGPPIVSAKATCTVSRINLFKSSGVISATVVTTCGATVPLLTSTIE